MYRSAMCVGLSLGSSTPRIRGMVVLLLALALFVTGIVADHQHLAVAADDLAILADPFHARSHLHETTAPRCRFMGRFMGKSCYSSAPPDVQGGCVKTTRFVGWWSPPA